MRPLVIYHANCTDGFTAAWCAWLRYGDAADYYAATHGTRPPDVSGRKVLIVDFSYPRATMLEMAARASSILVLDHHKTAEADLAGLSFAKFDMDQSGAGLAWNELHKDKSRSALVSYVEDRDLWRFQLPNSKQVNAWIGLSEQTFENWSKLDLEIAQGDLRSIIASGEAALKQIAYYVREAAKHARIVKIAGHEVPCVNASHVNMSELVGHLAERANAPFAVGWFQQSDGRYAYSLRSRNGFDVSAIAREYGGGGHRAAAGFVVAERIE